MIFCGQCGLQLAPGSTRCPRCGTPVDPADVGTGADFHVDDATVASRAFIVQRQTPPQTPNSQQPLILPANSGYGYGVPSPGDATSRVEQVNYNPQYSPAQQIMGNSYAGYPPQASGSYQPLPGSSSAYPIQNTGAYASQVSHPGYSSQPGIPYTDVPPPAGGSYPQYSVQSQYMLPPRTTSTKGRTTGLILVLIGLLLILSAVVLFAMQQGLIR